MTEVYMIVKRLDPLRDNHIEFYGPCGWFYQKGTYGYHWDDKSEAETELGKLNCPTCEIRMFDLEELYKETISRPYSRRSRV
jgi:hypothetical protein